MTATVRRDGVTISATFPRRDHAQRWAVACQDAIVEATERKLPFDRIAWLRRGRERTPAKLIRQLKEQSLEREPNRDDRPRAEWSLGRALRHYAETVTVTKKGAEQESVRLAAWQKRDLAAKRLDRVAAADIQAHIDARTAAGRAAMTVRNEVLLLSSIYKLAASAPRPGGNGGGWGLAGLANPVTPCALPSPPSGRERRLEDGREEGDEGEEAKMLAALAAGQDAPVMVALFVLAVETGMRLGEILDVRPSQVRRVRGARYVERPDSKNGKPRRVVLSTKAAAVIDSLLETADLESDRPVIRLGLTAVENRWRTARARAGVDGLRLHDLRHEGLSRMAALGLTIGELQAQSGHRTAQVLLRYVNARVQDVAKKLG